MRGKTYRFRTGSAGFNSNHVFQVYYGGTSMTHYLPRKSMTITIPSNQSTTSGDLYYRCVPHSGMRANMKLLYREIVNLAKQRLHMTSIMELLI